MRGLLGRGNKDEKRMISPRVWKKIKDEGSRRGLVFSIARTGSLPNLELLKKRAAPLRVPEQVAPQTSTSKSVDIHE